MTTRTKRRSLLLGSLTMVLGSAAFLCWVSLAPPETNAWEEPTIRPGAAPTKLDAQATRDDVNLDDECWTLPLRRPLYDPPPDPATPRERDVEVVRRPSIPRVKFRLLGLAIEKGQSRAIVTDSKQQIDVRGEGEILQLDPDGAVIKEIRNDAVIITYQGVDQSIPLDK